MGQNRFSIVRVWKPATYFVAVLAIIFTAEALVMYVLALVLPPIDDMHFEAFMDASMLTVLTAPILWWLLIKPLRQAAKQQSDRYLQLINDARDAIAIVDDEGFLELLNPAAEGLLGFKLHADDRRRFTDYLPEFESILANCRWHDDKQIQQGQLNCPFGRSFAVEYSVSTLRESHGTYHTLIIRDVSERVAAEEQKLRDHRAQVESAHLAGKAEVATSVLHNVGNTLTSISVLTEKLISQAQASRVDGLERVTYLLRENENDLAGFFAENSRAKQLPTYLQSLSTRLREEHSEQFDNMQVLQEHVQHAARIVAAQQAFARSPGIEEETDVAEIIDNAIEIARASLSRHSVRIDKQVAPLPNCFVDRHKLIQIVVNLLTNAKDAVKALPLENRMVRITGQIVEGHRFQITVRDYGEGIDKENMRRIFSQGFTTKSDGHGFGLHFCANAANEMSGRLSVRSDGIGHGAEFILELPLQAELAETS